MKISTTLGSSTQGAAANRLPPRPSRPRRGFLVATGVSAVGGAGGLATDMETPSVGVGGAARPPGVRARRPAAAAAPRRSALSELLLRGGHGLDERVDVLAAVEGGHGVAVGLHEFT